MILVISPKLHDITFKPLGPKTILFPHHYHVLVEVARKSTSYQNIKFTILELFLPIFVFIT